MLVRGNMAAKEIELLTSIRFFPLFISQLVAVFNDNIFKSTLIMLVTFSIVQHPEKAQLLANLIGGVYGSAFLLFSLTIGQLADKFNRVWITQFMKCFEILLIGIGMFSLYINNIELALFIIFLLGVHSAFLSPIKFSLLPDLLLPKDLLAGNSLIVAGAVTGIFVGTILGLFFGGVLETAMIIMSVSFIFAVLSFVASLYIPKAPRLDPTLKINVKDIYHSIQYVFTDKKIFVPMLALAWSVLVGVVFVRQFPIYSKMFISAQQIYVLTLFTPFAIGVVMGALLCRRILKGLITPRHTSFSLLLLSLFLFDFAWTTSHMHSAQLIIYSIDSIRILSDTFLFAFVAGIFIVPLYTNLQVNSHADHRARVLSLSNFLISLFAVLAAVFVIILIKLHFSIVEIYVIIGLLNSAMAIYFIRVSRS